MNKTIREQYFDNEIFKIGDIVKDNITNESVKVIDRGSNYVTVESTSGTSKKWLHDISAIIVEETSIPIQKDPDFILTKSGQVKTFGYETKCFDTDLSEFILEQFSEFSDMYSKHQIIKLLDSALNECTNINRQYELLEKVSAFYTTQNIQEPLLVEGMKSSLERKRIAEIVASIAETPVDDKSPYNTVNTALEALKKKYTDRKQWEVLYPFFRLVNNAGILGILSKVPFGLQDSGKGIENNPQKIDYKLQEEIISLLEDNIQELLESLTEEDLLETFCESEDEDVTADIISEEQIDEVLSFAGRMHLGQKMRARETGLVNKRMRALTHGASSAVLLSRAKRLAETLLKRMIFHKAPKDMNRQEKERFEAGASRRRSLVARLAQRLVPKVRMLQSARMQNNQSNPGQKFHHGSNLQNKQTPVYPGNNKNLGED